MTDLERYALNDGGESIETLVSDLERCQQDLATARENYTTARDNYRDSQCEIAAFYVTLATALNLPVETPAADLRALLWRALRERAALVSDLERVTAERDDALDEAKSADLHRNLNRRVADALGLLDERVDADTGETYLPSWHDMPEQVTALRAEVDRLTAERDAHSRAKAANSFAQDSLRDEIDMLRRERHAERLLVQERTAEIVELRLTLAAEQGRAEGAPSESWRYVHTGDGHGWALPSPNADSAAADEWARVDYRIRPLPRCDVSRISDGIWFLRWHPDLRRDSTGHYTARAAMIAAKDGP
jgi:hypothetical protein